MYISNYFDGNDVYFSSFVSLYAEISYYDVFIIISNSYYKLLCHVKKKELCRKTRGNPEDDLIKNKKIKK